MGCRGFVGCLLWLGITVCWKSLQRVMDWRERLVVWCCMGHTWSGSPRQRCLTLKDQKTNQYTKHTMTTHLVFRMQRRLLMTIWYHGSHWPCFTKADQISTMTYDTGIIFIEKTEKGKPHIYLFIYFLQSLVSNYKSCTNWSTEYQRLSILCLCLKLFWYFASKSTFGHCVP